MALATLGQWWGARTTATYLYGGFLLGMGAGVLLGSPFIPLPQRYDRAEPDRTSLPRGIPGSQSFGEMGSMKNLST